jgi:hypothetical protein
LKDVWYDVVNDLARQYNWDRKRACDISPFKTPNGTTVYESKFNYRLPDDYDILERAASMRFAVNETAEGVREALANQLAFVVLASESPLVAGSSAIASRCGDKIPVVGSGIIKAMAYHNVSLEISFNNKAYHSDKVYIALLAAIEAMPCSKL